jgi:hypothetical protein
MPAVVDFPVSNIGTRMSVGLSLPAEKETMTTGCALSEIGSTELHHAGAR